MSVVKRRPELNQININYCTSWGYLRRMGLLILILHHSHVNVIWLWYGQLHRAASSNGLEHFRKFIKLSTANRLCTSSATGRHSTQLIHIRKEHFLQIEKCSALWLIYVYDKVSATVIRHDKVNNQKVAATSDQRSPRCAMLRLEDYVFATNACILRPIVMKPIISSIV